MASTRHKSTATPGQHDLDRVFAEVQRAGEAWFENLRQQAGQLPAVGLPANASPSADTWFDTWLRQSVDLTSRALEQWLGWTQVSNAWLQNASLAVGSREDTQASGDRRFAAPEWREYPLFDYIRQSYQMVSDAMMQAVQDTNLAPDVKKQMVFATEQFLDAASPSNYALTNPEVLKLAVQTRGESFRQGLANLAADLKRGHISQADETAFAVGENVANTPGEVVFQNDIVQLIQYTPTTEQVRQTPLLIISSIVNKYYLMDLSEQMSCVRWLVEQGNTVFITSYRNPGPDEAHLTFDDYIQQAVLEPIAAVQGISKQEQIHTVGYCVGGALLGCALAVLARRDQAHPAASMTLLMSLYDAADPGEIGIYLSRNAIALRDRVSGGSGLFSGKDLTRVFSSLRANDMIWGFVVNNYLKGKTPDAFNLFYWNTDDVNVPWPMFSYYLREGYLDNHLIVPDAMTVLDTPVDLRLITCPVYGFAAVEDHLVPWKSAYQSGKHLGGETTFVLGGGGHITGPINPVARNRRNYWLNDEYGGEPDQWLAGAESHPGSWWPHWDAWLAEHGSGKMVKAPRQAGNKQHPPLEPAPGAYARMRSVLVEE